jgi:hypothetical protein
MSLPVPDFVPNEILAQRALALLREHERRSGGIVSLPVPVEMIVEQTLQLQIVPVNIEEIPGEVILARITPDYLGHPTIQLNERRMQHFEEYFGTEAFSLGHEAGHWVLHFDRGRSEQPTLPGLLDSGMTPAPILCRRLTNADRREIQAERFAAYLLMPEHLVAPLVRDRRLDALSEIRELGRQCGVSRRAFTRRLEELGLVRLLPDGNLDLAPTRHSPLL